MNQETQRPIKEFRAGRIRAAIWRNETASEGGQRTHYSVRIEKSYFDSSRNEWRPSEYFFANDLPRLRLLADRAFEFITLLEDGERADFGV